MNNSFIMSVCSTSDQRQHRAGDVLGVFFRPIFFQWDLARSILLGFYHDHRRVLLFFLRFFNV